jgi:hypothetical protein
MPSIHRLLYITQLFWTVWSIIKIKRGGRLRPLSNDGGKNYLDGSGLGIVESKSATRIFPGIRIADIGYSQDQQIPGLGLRIDPREIPIIPARGIESFDPSAGCCDAALRAPMIDQQVDPDLICAVRDHREIHLIAGPPDIARQLVGIIEGSAGRNADRHHGKGITHPAASPQNRLTVLITKEKDDLRDYGCCRGAGGRGFTGLGGRRRSGGGRGCARGHNHKCREIPGRTTGKAEEKNAHTENSANGFQGQLPRPSVPACSLKIYLCQASRFKRRPQPAKTGCAARDEMPPSWLRHLNDLEIVNQTLS